jgi:hypothetical protein
VDWEGLFWRSLVIYFATPTFGAYGTVGTADHLFFFLALCSGHYFISYFMERREGRDGRLRDLYLGAAFLGLCALTKYNALLMGLGVAFYVIAIPRLRRLLLNPHLYLAALLSLAVASPMLIWNAANGFASFNYHLVERHGAGFLEALHFDSLVEFFAISLVALGPFLILGIARFLLARPAENYPQTMQGLGAWVFWVSTLVFAAIALADEAYFWWNVPAVILMMPLMGRYMGRIALWGHVTLSTALCVFYVISATVVPLLVLGGIPDSTRARYFGWEQIETPLKAAIEKYQPDFIGSSRWEYASLAGFVLDDKDVVSIDPRPSQYHYWFDPAAHRGQNAVLLTHSQNAQQQTIDDSFDKVTLVEEIPVIRFGKRLGTYRLYYGEGFKPLWSKPGADAQ